MDTELPVNLWTHHSLLFYDSITGNLQATFPGIRAFPSKPGEFSVSSLRSKSNTTFFHYASLFSHLYYHPYHMEVVLFFYKSISSTRRHAVVELIVPELNTSLKVLEELGWR